MFHVLAQKLRLRNRAHLFFPGQFASGMSSGEPTKRATVIVFFGLTEHNRRQRIDCENNSRDRSQAAINRAITHENDLPMLERKYITNGRPWNNSEAEFFPINSSQQMRR